MTAVMPAQNLQYASSVEVLLQPGQKVAEVRVVPKEGTVLNPDAPWELTLNKASTAAKLKFEAADFKFDPKGLKASLPISTLQPLSQAKDLDFKLVYFVCNTAKTWCKRMVASSP
jgi:hypothetical protein